MVTKRKSREARRAGSKKRDAQHRAGGEWTTLAIPDGVDIFQPKEGNYRIDIVPFVAGKGNPYAESGELYYERTFFIHRGIGPNNESYVCLLKTFGKPCPICEYRAKLSNDPDADDKLLKDLKPRERQLFLIYDRKEPEKKIQLWEVSYFVFGALLDKRRKDAEEDEPHITDFDDPDSGSMLKIGFSEEDGGGFNFLKAYSIDFKPRSNGLPREVMDIDHDICLDDILKETSYDQLKAIFHQEEDGSGVEDDEPEEKPAPKRKKSLPVDKDTLDNDDLSDAEPKKKKPPVEDDDDEWDDDFDDLPKEKGKKKAVESDDDDDDLDDDDDDWPEDDDD